MESIPTQANKTNETPITGLEKELKEILGSRSDSLKAFDLPVIYSDIEAEVIGDFTYSKNSFLIKSHLKQGEISDIKTAAQQVCYPVFLIDKKTVIPATYGSEIVNYFGNNGHVHALSHNDGYKEIKVKVKGSDSNAERALKIFACHLINNYHHVPKK